jgi:hypothetical protein
MLRAIWLTMQNEARLLFVDPIVLFMLLMAPIVIITVAGYSLGSLYGGVASSFRTPVVDLDRGQVSAALIDALRANRSLEVEIARDENQARQAVIAAMAGGAKRPHMLLGVGGIVMTTSSEACGRFALFHSGAAGPPSQCLKECNPIRGGRALLPVAQLEDLRR